MARSRKQRGRPPVKPDPKLQGNDRRREITDAALGLFAERSFASVTIKDIAGKLRINPALIYYYFESKQDLFRSSIEAAIFDAVAHYDRIRSLHDDPVGLIDAWLESNVNLSRTISNLVKVMLDHSELPRHIPSVDRLVKRFTRRNIAFSPAQLATASKLVYSNQWISDEWHCSHPSI